MRKSAITLVMALSLLLSAFGFATGAAAQNAPDGCEKIRGTIYCVEQEPVGNSGKYKTTTVSQKGSFQSSHEPNCTYTNPGGNQPSGKQGC